MTFGPSGRSVDRSLGPRVKAFFGQTRYAGAAPPMASDLARVKGADVFLFFIESYGAVSWDRPAWDCLAIWITTARSI